MYNARISFTVRLPNVPPSVRAVGGPWEAPLFACACFDESRLRCTTCRAPFQRRGCWPPAPVFAGWWGHNRERPCLSRSFVTSGHDRVNHLHPIRRSPTSPEILLSRGDDPFEPPPEHYPLSQKPRSRDHHPFGATAVEDLSACHRIASAKLRFTAASQEPTPSTLGRRNRPAHLFHPLSTRPHRPGCARVSFRLRPAPFLRREPRWYRPVSANRNCRDVYPHLVRFEGGVVPGHELPRFPSLPRSVWAPRGSTLEDVKRFTTPHPLWWIDIGACTPPRNVFAPLCGAGVFFPRRRCDFTSDAPVVTTFPTAPRCSDEGCREAATKTVLPASPWREMVPTIQSVFHRWGPFICSRPWHPSSSEPESSEARDHRLLSESMTAEWRSWRHPGSWMSGLAFGR